MRSSQVAVVADMVKSSDEWGTSPVKDELFLKVDKLLEDCSRSEDCSRCQVLQKCLSAHNRVSSLSADHKLSQSELIAYLSKFQQLLKSKKAEPFGVVLVTGVVICGGYFGVPLHFSLLRH
jgi:hypothetical protein